MPRVVNLGLAAFLLLFLVPLCAHFGSRSAGVQVMLGFVAVLFGLLTLACLASAGRPGSLGRLVTRLRARPRRVRGR